MRGPARAVVVLLFAMSLSGCLDDDGPGATPPVSATPPVVSALVGAIEPDGLQAPTFRLVGAIAQGGPVYGAGEPSIWATLDGTIYLAFPGCDSGFNFIVSDPTATDRCAHGLVWKSTDGGSTFERLNRRPDGRLGDDGPEANGDADVTVDAAGTIYVSNLGGGGIQLHKSEDGGTTWSYVGNIVPTLEDDAERHEGADRQWLAAATPGHVINTWMRTSPKRDVAVNATFDGGANWTGATYYGDGIGWLGTVQFAPDGQHAYIPYTQPLTEAVVFFGAQKFAMHVLVTDNGGLDWTDVDTGATWTSSATGGHWSGTQMAPSLDVTGDGTVIVAWTQDRFVDEVRSPITATGDSTVLYIVTSSDNGTTWTAPRAVVPPGPADLEYGSTIMPWVVGGAGDRFAITFLHTDSPVDSDYAGTVWDIMALVADGFATEAQRLVFTTIEANVHQGGICTRGGLCLLTGSDRALLDFFESDLLPDGRLVVVYPADPLSGGKKIDIRVAVQDGGTPLLVRAT